MLGWPLLTRPVSAAQPASFSLSTQNLSVATGQYFSVAVGLDPGEAAVDTVRLHVNFDPTLLQAQTVSLGSTMTQTSPGSAIDNVAGSINWGGFTFGTPLTVKGTVMTLNFKALRTGTGAITLNSSSLALQDGENFSNGATSTTTVSVVANADSGGTTSSGEVPSVVVVDGLTLTVTSATHPDKNAWYKSRDVQVTWAMQGGSPREFLTMFDLSPDTDPSQSDLTRVIDGSVRDMLLTLGSDGLWYFHIKMISATGAVSSTVHFPLHIDSTPPSSLSIDPDTRQLLAGEPVSLAFGAIDDLSGVADYAISINGGEYLPATSPYQFKNTVAGDILFGVRATDNAGNETFASTRLRVYDEDSLFASLIRAKEVAVRGLKFTLWIAVGLLIISALTCGILFGVRYSKRSR